MPREPCGSASAACLPHTASTTTMLHSSAAATMHVLLLHRAHCVSAAAAATCNIAHRPGWSQTQSRPGPESGLYSNDMHECTSCRQLCIDHVNDNVHSAKRQRAVELQSTDRLDATVHALCGGIEGGWDLVVPARAPISLLVATIATVEATALLLVASSTVRLVPTIPSTYIRCMHSDHARQRAHNSATLTRQNTTPYVSATGVRRWTPALQCGEQKFA